MEEPTEEIEVQPFFGSFILETLTLGMYAESRNAIREYVQNSFDSIRQARSEGLLATGAGTIRVIMSEDALTILDDGVGMSSDTAGSFLTSIGASRKDYRKQAGFRGIGRLSGLVLCDRLVFRTKSKGDRHETQVIFNARGLREDLIPSNAQAIPLDRLLRKHVKVLRSAATNRADHFFAVDLLGLHEPPAECISPFQMAEFLGEVAPVGYRSEFLFGRQIISEAERRHLPIEAVRVLVVSGDDEHEVTKPYGEKFTVGSLAVPLTNIAFKDSAKGYWWGWTSEKDVSGTFSGNAAGIRVRVRNIQIDGTELMRDIFADTPGAKTYTRFNEWYMGEIFVTHDDLIPNARRDGFEENKAWLAARAELIDMCKGLGSAAYKLSARNQVSMTTLVADLRALDQSKDKLKKSPPDDVGGAIEFSKSAEKLQRKIGKAIKLSGELDEISQLRRLETRLLSARAEVLSRFGGSNSVDRVMAAREAEQALLEQIVQLFGERLEPRINAIVMDLLEEAFGDGVRRRRN